jgi:hypothetical protein
MSIIHFTPADALQTTVVEAGVYPSEISKIEGPKASSSGKSTNYFVDVRITEGRYKGKEATIAFSSGSNGASLLGTMQWFPTSGLLLVDAAINNKKVEPVDYNLDTDVLLSKPLETQWTVQTVEGILVNAVVAFFPTGYSNDKPVF